MVSPFAAEARVINYLETSMLHRGGLKGVLWARTRFEPINESSAVPTPSEGSFILRVISKALRSRLQKAKTLAFRLSSAFFDRIIHMEFEFSQNEIIFNDHERWISGVPERLPIAEGGRALAQVRRARSHCYGAFMTLLRCDMDLLTDVEAASIPLYPQRLRQLDAMYAALSQHSAS